MVLASNGQEALVKVSQFDISLILLDIIMPRLDGFEVLDRIRQYEHILVIMLSGIREVTAIIDTLTLGDIHNWRCYRVGNERLSFQK